MNTFVSTYITGKSTLDDLSAAQTAYTTFLNSGTLIVPQAGKFYRVKNALAAFNPQKTMYVQNGALQWGNINEQLLGQVWQFIPADGGFLMQNALTGLQVTADRTMGQTGANITISHAANPSVTLSVTGATGANVAWHANGHSNGQGTTGTVIVWAAPGPSAPLASQWVIEEVQVDGQTATDVQMATLGRNAELSTLITSKSANVGAEWGQFPQSVVDDATTVKNNASATLVEVQQAYNALNAAHYNTPDASKKYWIVCASTQTVAGVYEAGKTYVMYSDAASGKLKWGEKSKTDLQQQWQFTDGALQCVGDQKYAQTKVGGNSAVPMGTTPVNVILSSLGSDQWAITTQGSSFNTHTHFHLGGRDNTSSNNHEVMLWDTQAGGYSAWKLEEVVEDYTAGDLAAALTAQRISAALGDYTLTDQTVLQAVETAQADGATSEQIGAAVTALQGLTAEGKTLNRPVAGTYYRIKAWNTQKYLNVTTGTGAAGTSYVADATGETEASTIIYLTKDNELLSYTQGRVFNRNASSGGNSYFSDLIDETRTNDQCAFYAGSQPGTITIDVHGAREGWLHSTATDTHINMCSADAQATSTGKSTDDAHAWVFEPVVTLPLTVSAAGYATFYGGAALEMPAGLMAYAVQAPQQLTDHQGELTLTEITTAVPKETPVLVAGQAQKYDLTISTQTPAAVETALVGSLDCHNIAAQTDNVFILAQKDAGVGFYKLNTEAASVLKGHRAWLEWSAAPAGVQGLTFNFGTATGLQSILPAQSAQGAAVYDLQGRRVTAPGHGLYIVGGKKVIL